MGPYSDHPKREAKLKSIIRGSPIPQFVIVKDRKVIYWNHALEKYCNSKLAEGAYESVSSFRAEALRDSKGNIIGAVETLEDITEQRKAQEDLEKTNKKLLRMNRKLGKLSLVDSHTGLFNHRYFEEIAESEFSRAKRDVLPLSMIMLDIDFFKSINDVYGHRFGDLVLKQFAAQLKKAVRRYDSIIRYGGEEFVIVCPGANRPVTLLLARRILDAVTKHKFGDRTRVINLKISIGVASYPEDEVFKSMDLFDTADRALNKAKEDGGDRAYSSLDVMNEGPPHSPEEIEGINSLKEKINNLNRRSSQGIIEAVCAFARTMKLRDRYTGQHVESTVRFATDMGRELGLSRKELEIAEQAAVLHDLGKVGINESILRKKAKLTKNELEKVKRHPSIAADILRNVHYLRDIVPAILYHHERWDGKGYPKGLKGEEIPVVARIIALADVFQALLSNRPYRKAYSKDNAIKLIEKASGTQFDPKVVRVFSSVVKKARF
ncbi:MAG: diguanylate cyclase [Candidatus Omnitrophota bacterium]